LGIICRKVADLFEVAFGLKVTAGGLCQVDERLAGKAEPVYQELVGEIRRSCVLETDEAGWRVGLLSSWL